MIRTRKNEWGETKEDVFDEQLNFRGSFDHEGSIELIQKNMAYAVSEDSEGFPIIQRHEIKRRQKKKRGPLPNQFDGCIESKDMPGPATSQ